jgi:hypothetical protein
VLFQFTVAPYEYVTPDPSVPTIVGTSVTFDYVVPTPLIAIEPALAPTRWAWSELPRREAE